jgi:sulfite reductase alpha subunit-like flavoprotein
MDKAVDITMAVTEFKTKFGRQISGICSSWLREAKKDEVVPVWLKKGSLRFALDRPLIFVGPGTGVAAFRSAIYSLRQSKHTIVLIFGCRSKQEDYYYADEWTEL